jgi:[ribosomal protein S18]-alanine N-acetyltransferase
MEITIVELSAGLPVPEEVCGRIYEIDRASTTFPWSFEAIANEFANPCGIRCIAREDGEAVVGFLLGATVADEFCIHNCAVHPLFQRQGIGKRLIESALEAALKRGALHAYLEVRSKNGRAIGLYEKLGFRTVSVRRKYYGGDGDDAFVMHLQMNAVP